MTDRILYSAELTEVDGRYELTIIDHDRGAVQTARLKKTVVDKLPVFLAKLTPQDHASFR